MSEILPTHEFTVPPSQDFDTAGYNGSMQQILQQNIGNYVTVDFLIGTNTTITKQGVLYAVGSQYMVLYDDLSLRYTVCDIFTVKFVTFLLPGFRPGQVPAALVEQLIERAALQNAAQPASEASPVPEAQPTQSAAASPSVTPAQAAFAHVTGRGSFRH